MKVRGPISALTTDMMFSEIVEIVGWVERSETHHLSAQMD
jgi:hypothetical protein